MTKARLDHAKHTAGRSPYNSSGGGLQSVGDGQVTNTRLTRQQKDIEKHTARMVKSKSMREQESMMKAEMDGKKNWKRGVRKAKSSRVSSAQSSTYNSTNEG